MQINNMPSPSFKAFRIHPIGEQYVSKANEFKLKQIRDIAELATDSRNYDVILGDGKFYVKYKQADYYVPTPEIADVDNNNNLVFSVAPTKDIRKNGPLLKDVKIEHDEPQKIIQRFNNAPTILDKFLIFFEVLDDPKLTKNKQKTEQLRKELLKKYL